MTIKPLIVPLIVVAAIAAAGWYVLRPQAETFGRYSTDADVVSIGDLNETHVGHTVAIEGTIVTECPHSGCWAVIEDSTGQIRIDTNKGGFALPLRREGSTIRVIGELEQTDSGDLLLSAEGAQL
jgi:uncharacterized protein YdeI (BOF family)